MSEKIDPRTGADRSAAEILQEEQRNKAAAYAQSSEGQKETVQKFRDWAFKEYEACRESVVTRAEWVDETGRRMIAVYPSIFSGANLPPNALISSNHKAVRARLDKLRALLATCDAMLAQLKQDRHRTLPENYQDTLNDLMPPPAPKAGYPMEIVQQPKPIK